MNDEQHSQVLLLVVQLLLIRNNTITNMCREREIGMCSAIEEHTLTFDDLTTATMAKNNARKK